MKIEDEKGGACSTRREMRHAYKVLVIKPEWRRPLEDLGVDRKITVEWILGKQGGRLWTGCIWLRIGTSGGPL
jgi:hypothetical protein